MDLDFLIEGANIAKEGIEAFKEKFTKEEYDTVLKGLLTVNKVITMKALEEL